MSDTFYLRCENPDFATSDPTRILLFRYTLFKAKRLSAQKLPNFKARWPSELHEKYQAWKEERCEAWRARDRICGR